MIFNIFNIFNNEMAEKFMNEIYDANTETYNKDLITFILISIFIIYFIFSLISSFFKLPFIILLGTVLGMYLYNLFGGTKNS